LVPSGDQDGLSCGFPAETNSEDVPVTRSLIQIDVLPAPSLAAYAIFVWSGDQFG